MKIVIKLVSIGGGESGESEREVAEDTRLADIPAMVGLDDDETFAMLVNNMPVPPEERPSHVLSEGDLITVFPPIKGG